MMPRQGTMIADRYRLERKVGGGRVSAMWRVQDQVSSGACAIKLLHRSMNDHPEALARFSLEDRLARELTGAYFPERIGSGSWHSLRYIAWRWYEGESLRSLFERTPKQDVQTVYSIVQETCQALSAVHAAGYTHGDLKPENLFFAERGEGEKEAPRQLKLLGFGVASRVARPLLGSQARRTPGQIVGTPLYLSPDLILGRVPRGGQADLWALSVMVYEALTGRAPFLGVDLAELLRAILERQAPRPSSVTDNLPGTFDVWWSQALDQQYATPTEFAASLARALAPALRSSRTQRSASLPDRIVPELVPQRSLTSSAGPVGAARASALTPAGGLAAAQGPTLNAPSNGSPAVSAAATGVSAAPLGSVTSLGVGGLGLAVSKAQEGTPLVPPAVAKAGAADAGLAAATAASLGTRTELRAALEEAPVAGSADPAQTPAVPALEPAARAPGTPVASTTVAGIGPTAVSVRRALEAAAAGAKIRLAPLQADAGRDATRSDKASADKASADKASADKASGDGAGADRASRDKPNADRARSGQASAREARSDQASAHEARSDQASAHKAPSDHRAGSDSASADKPGRDADKFAPLPSPLRDLGIGARKTLVGIIPPSALPSAPNPSLASLATAPGSAASPRPLGAPSVIAGTPCKSIEIPGESEQLEPPPSIAALRRLGSPTVPFPRPRAASRGTAREAEPASPDSFGRATIPQSWQRTGETLRIVLTDPDHRPHLVAGFVVCAAAALVIFLAGRSPVAGTGVLGQTTGALTVEPAVAPLGRTPASLPRTAPKEPSAGQPSAGSVSRALSASEPHEVLPPEPTTELAKGPGLNGEELAPGLILPPRAPTNGPGTASGARPDKPKAAVSSPSPLPPTRGAPVRAAAPAGSGPAGSAPGGPAAAPEHRGPLGAAAERVPAPTPEPHPSNPSSPVPPRAAPKKPGPEPAPPARPGNGDFDFGI